jgi:hypothetical protein
MTIMTREICRALDIDIHALLDMVRNPESSLHSGQTAVSHTSSEMACDLDNSHESMDISAPE